MKSAAIVWLSNVPATAAPTYQLFNIGQSLAKRGLAVTLHSVGYLSQRKANPAKTFEHYGIQHRFGLRQWPLRAFFQKLPSSRWARSLLGGTVAALVAARRPDILLTRHSAVALWAMRLGVNVAYETHPSPLGEERTWDGKEFEPQLIPLMRKKRFRSLTTLAEVVADAFVELGAPREKILVRPSGIDLTRYENLPSPTEARRRVGLPSDRPIVLYAGSLNELKGTHLVFELARRLPEIRFALIGPWTQSSLAEQLKQQPPSPHLGYHGVISAADLPTWQAAADILILPTLSTLSSAAWTSPLKLFEYMAAGRPLVSSSLPNIRPIIRHGVNGLLVEDDAVAGYVAAIEQILADPAAAARLGEQARQDSALYTWDRRVDDLLEHINHRST